MTNWITDHACSYDILLDGFFTSITNVPLEISEGVHALQGNYVLDRYHDYLFAQAGIDYPAGIRKAVPKRQAEYLAGRHLSQLLFAAQRMDLIQIPSGTHRQPLWPTGWLGSISHTDNMAVVCLGSTSQVSMLGIDLENKLIPEIAHSIAPTIVDNREASYLFDLGSFEQMLTLAFSAKESFFKAIYPKVGYYFGFNTVRLIGIHTGTGHFTLEVTTDLCPQVHAGKIFEGLYQLKEHTVLTVIAGKAALGR